MQKLMPQELEVWYLIPSLRKELARIFTEDYKMTQKEASKILGITESAVSQYIGSKRAKSIRFSKSEIKEIKFYAHKIIEDKLNSRRYFYDLSTKLRGAESMCALHKKHDSEIPHNCSMCKGN